MFSKENKRLPDLAVDSRPFSPSSIVVSPKGSASPGFRIRRYLTSRIDKHPARKKLNYETPKKAHASTLPNKKTSSKAPTPVPVILPETEKPARSPSPLTQAIPIDASLSTLSARSDPEAPESENVLMHQANKLFWRINRTIDFRIYMCDSLGAVVVRSFDSSANSEFPPIVLEWAKIVPQVQENEAATAAHQAALSLFDKEVPVGTYEEEEILKQRRRKKDASRRKSENSMTEEQVEEARLKKLTEQEADRMREMDAMKGKVVSFVISRFEASKSKETGIITTSVVKRPSDSIGSFAFDETTLPRAALKVGSTLPWNKKENAVSIRRKSTELVGELKDVSIASKKASEKQLSIQMALDIVKALSDRDQFNSLSPHRKKFQMGIRKAIFQTRLEKMQVALSTSDEYKNFAAECVR
jgi:hypothetical protein